MHYFTSALALLSLSQSALAAFTCDSSNAKDYGTSGGSSTGSSSSGGGNGVDPNCPFRNQAYAEELCAQWMLNNGRAAGSGVLQGSIKRSSMPDVPYLRVRAAGTKSVQCQDGDVCAIIFAYYMCIDPNTYNYKDSNGGSGNANNDVYTMANGQTTKINPTATVLPTPTSGAAKKGDGSASGSASSASSTSTSGSGSGSNSGSGSGSGSAATSSNSAVRVGKDYAVASSAAAVVVALSLLVLT